ncbi:hypothetical protein [Paenibacillus sp. YN15]|uniref:hypothetical protein n=1 Tax=Paenibacillus sp. YN15 TaxID=1742774 RepID=UPI0011BF1285|nr:hypothetical protein [Paenibacillus sp. YN15]
MNKRLVPLLMAIILVLSLPLQASAASSARLSKTAKASVEKLAAQSNASLQTKLTEQSGKIQELESQDGKLNQEIENLHRVNADKRLAINTGIKQHNAEKLSQLKNEAAAARERYKPLFTLQTSLNKQLTAARKLKNKPLIEALEAQLSVVRVSALLAREEIRMKDTAYTKLKDAASKTVNAVRTVLKEASVEQTKIQSEKKASAETGKQIAAESKSLTAAIKSKDATETLRSLTALTTLSNQIINQKTRIISSEKKIAAILEKAASLLP